MFQNTNVIFHTKPTLGCIRRAQAFSKLYPCKEFRLLLSKRPKFNWDFKFDLLTSFLDVIPKVGHLYKRYLKDKQGYSIIQDDQFNILLAGRAKGICKHYMLLNPFTASVHGTVIKLFTEIATEFLIPFPRSLIISQLLKQTCVEQEKYLNIISNEKLLIRRKRRKHPDNIVIFGNTYGETLQDYTLKTYPKTENISFIKYNTCPEFINKSNKIRELEMVLDITEMLAKSDLFVCAGGYNSLADGVYAGLAVDSLCFNKSELEQSKWFTNRFRTVRTLDYVAKC